MNIYIMFPFAGMSDLVKPLLAFVLTTSIDPGHVRLTAQKVRKRNKKCAPRPNI